MRDHGISRADGASFRSTAQLTNAIPNENLTNFARVVELTISEEASARDSKTPSS